MAILNTLMSFVSSSSTRAWKYSSLPSSHPVSTTKRHNFGKKTLAVVVTAALLVFGAVEVFRPRGRWHPLHSFQDINPFPLVHQNFNASAPLPNQNAVVTSLYSDSFVFGAAVLGHSIQHSNTQARRILIYLKDQVSEQALCIARAAGWEPIAVPFIQPPHNGKGIHQRFRDQYTKLNIWALDKMGIERAVYLDADTLVLRSFDELFDGYPVRGFDFAAVPDINHGEFTVEFNAGVLVFRPSSEVLEEMKRKIETAVFDPQAAEQSFLNLFYGVNVVRLPYAYNANLETKRLSPAMWEGMRREIRVVHYTVNKPFVGWSPSQKIYTMQQQRDANYEAGLRDEGLFLLECDWWGTAFQRMVREIGTEVEACYP